VPFVIASVQADTAVMEERLKRRSRRGSDASEADISVLQKLQVFHEPLRDSELSAAVIFNNNGDVVALEAAEEWKSLEEHLA
jgi:predicted kinase